MSRYNSPSTSSSPLNTPSSSSFNKDEVEKQIKEWKEKLNKYICPISQELMIDPVIIESGHTFDRNSIEEWLKSKNTCPITRMELKVKSLTPNYSTKSTINEKVEKFIKKVIKHVKLWYNDVNLIEICSELINESLELIKNNINFNNYQKDLIELKFDILLNQKINESKLLDGYIKLIDELSDINLKIVQLQKLENKLVDRYYLHKYYEKLLNLLIENKRNDTLLKEIFTKYCKLNYVIGNDFINSILDYINNDDIKLEYLIILINNNEKYDKDNLAEKLVKIKISNKMKQRFISFFRNLIDRINITDYIYNFISNSNLTNLIDYIKDYNELNKEKVIIYNKLYKNSNDIKYLEIIYELDNNDKEIEQQLLNKYLELNLLDKYLNLYIKVNENKLDSNNIVLFKLLKNQNNKIENQNKKIENQNKEINNLQQTNINQNKEISDLKQLNINQNQKINTLQQINVIQNQKIDILQQTINNTNNFINNCLLQNNNLENELKEWNKQIINNFKIKYPEYDYVNIINIITPLNVKQNERFFSDEFEVFGLKWKIQFNAKGDYRSKENECAIFLCLKSLQYKIENEEEKEISSIKIKYLIDSINLNDNRNDESIFTEITGYGSSHFKQSNFIPIIKNDKQIFSVVIGIKKLDIKFK
ncbi:hypothetical protein ABK040_014636 [Willaertia magna]